MDNLSSPVNLFNHDAKKKTSNKKKKSFLFMKTAMSLLRTKTDGDKKNNTISKPPKSPTSHNVLNQILDSVRPLHVSDTLFPASPINHHLHRHQSSDSFDSLSSPCYSSFGESSTVYGSSNSLQDLENQHVQESEFDEGGGECRHRRGLRKTRASSPFASAMNLLELGSDGESDGEDDRHVEEEDVADDNGGDDMIDTKADAFITQFYSKMRVQG